MARVREFDTERALEKAMQLFWHKGYAETTVRDLVEHTGVAHAGLYAAFGGKRSLFQAALKRYCDTILAGLIQHLESPDSGLAEIDRLFKGLLEQVKAGGWKDGCFMCNTAIEFGDEPGDILNSVNRNLDRITAAFAGALGRAKDCGDIRADLDPRSAAEFLSNLFIGSVLRVRAKSPLDGIEQGVTVGLQSIR